MNDTNQPNELSRRSVLRQGTLATGTLLVGGAALTGTVAGSPRTNFAYVSSDVTVGDRVTLESRTGERPNLNCNDAGANIRTTAWVVSGAHDGIWYTIPNGYKGGERVDVVGEAISCADSDLAEKEVQITKV